MNINTTVYSEGSITRKGLIAFQITPEKLTPIMRSNEMITAKTETANSIVTNNIFTCFTFRKEFIFIVLVSSFHYSGSFQGLFFRYIYLNKRAYKNWIK